MPVQRTASRCVAILFPGLAKQVLTEIDGVIIAAQNKTYQIILHNFQNARAAHQLDAQLGS